MFALDLLALLRQLLALFRPEADCQNGGQCNA